FLFFSSRRRHTRLVSDWSSDVCSSDLGVLAVVGCAALALGACSSANVEKVYSTDFWVQPGKYDFIKCPDLAKRSIADSAREKEQIGRASCRERGEVRVGGG